MYSFENINSMMTLFVPLITVIITVIVNIVITKFQLKKYELDIKTQKEIADNVIKRDVKATNRQQWINTLRDLVSEYIANHEFAKLVAQFDPKINGEKRPEYKEAFKKVLNLGYKIELMLNPTESKSQKVVKLMTELNKVTNYSSFAYEDKYEQIKHEILDVTKEILKEEWEKVKRLE